jgi:hypothetical protein
VNSPITYLIIHDEHYGESGLESLVGKLEIGMVEKTGTEAGVGRQVYFV